MNRWPHFAAAQLAIFAPAALAATYLDIEQAQQAIFPGATFTPANITLTREQMRAIEKRSGVNVREAAVRAWRISGGGWLLVDDVVGKHDFITYAVGVDADGSVRAIEILEYRESYGYEIRDPRWRAQFVGKTSAAPLRLERDIQNISGATLSCRHVTDGVKRLLALHELVLK